MAIDNLGMFQGRPVEQKKIQLGNLGEGTYKGIVTPQMQRMGGINKTGYKIEDIIEKEVVRDRFQRNEFPQFEKTSDGIFFQPIGKVFSTFGNYYICFIGDNYYFADYCFINAFSNKEKRQRYKNHRYAHRA